MEEVQSDTCSKFITYSIWIWAARFVINKLLNPWFSHIKRIIFGWYAAMIWIIFAWTQDARKINIKAHTTRSINDIHQSPYHTIYQWYIPGYCIMNNDSWAINLDLRISGTRLFQTYQQQHQGGWVMIQLLILSRVLSFLFIISRPIFWRPCILPRVFMPPFHPAFMRC